MPKESVEVFCGGHIAIIDDFKSLTTFGSDKQKFKFKGQDKGHAAELEAFVSAIKKGTSTPISFEEQYISTRSEEHTSELQSRGHLVCRLLLEKKKYTCQ